MTLDHTPPELGADRRAWQREIDMDEQDFEGTLVLERLAEIGRIEDFFDAVDSDDVERAAALMRKARIDASTIAMVIEKMEAGDGEH